MTYHPLFSTGRLGIGELLLLLPFIFQSLFDFTVKKEK